MNNRDKVSCERGLEKEDVGYIHNGILLSHKKKSQNTAICDNTDGSREYYSKSNKPVRKI